MIHAGTLLEQLALADRRAAAWCACQCVRSVLHLIPSDDRPRRAIEATEAWVRGEANTGAVTVAATATLEAIEQTGRRPQADVVSAAYAAADTVTAAAAHVLPQPTDPPGENVATAASYAASCVACAVAFAEVGVLSSPDACAVHDASWRRCLEGTLLELVSTIRWPLILPDTIQLEAAPEPLQVAWDLIAADPRTDHAIPTLIEAHARAQHLGLDWSDPVQRAIAERMTTEAGALPGQLRRLLASLR